MRSQFAAWTSRISVILAAAVIVVSLSVCIQASSPLVLPGDWRYRAIAELAAGGLVDPEDAVVYASSTPIPVDRLATSVHRLAQRLQAQVRNANAISDGARAGESQPLLLYGVEQMGVAASSSSTWAEPVLTGRQANLISDLMWEFGLSSEGRAGRILGLSDLFLTEEVGLILNPLQAFAHGQSGVQPLALRGDSIAEHRQAFAGPTQAAEFADLEALLRKTIDSGDDKPGKQVQIGVPSPIGTLSVELSSQAASRPQQPQSQQPKAEEPPPATGFDLSTSVQLSDVLNVSAQFFADDKSREKATSTSVGVSIGEKDGAGLTVGHRVTDVGTPTDLAGRRETYTSVDVKYSLPDVASAVGVPAASDSLTVRAGYELYGREPHLIGAEQNSFQATMSLGIDYKLLLGDSAFLQAGYRYERVRDLISSGAVWTKSGLYDEGGFSSWLGQESLKLQGSNATRTIASIDFGYRLMENSSVNVGYKLIDFADLGVLELNKNLATAGVSIKF